jgi:hypothetical protein
MNKENDSWAWWYMPVTLTPGRLRQEDLKFKISLGYTRRPCLKNKTKRHE